MVPIRDAAGIQQAPCDDSYALGLQGRLIGSGRSGLGLGELRLRLRL